MQKTQAPEESVIEAKKIESLLRLLACVVESTKRNTVGRPANEAKERKLLATHVESIIGRKPDENLLNQIRYC